jgi:TonB family protein
MRFRYRVPVASLLFFAVSPSHTVAANAHPQESTHAVLPETQLRDLARRVLAKAGKADCKSPDCRILVANLALDSGETTLLGMHLADGLSRELASQQSGIQVIDLSLLRAYFEQERIPAQVFNQKKALQALGKHFGATTVLEGTTWEESGSLHVRVNLLSCQSDKRGPLEELITSYPDLAAALRPVEPYSKIPLVSQHSASNVLRAGVDGASTPICVYCPQPDYTSSAREAKVQGTALFDVTVSAGGMATDVTLLRGLPFGLNEMAMDTIRRWRFKPATREGNPIPVRVTIEVTYRLS